MLTLLAVTVLAVVALMNSLPAVLLFGAFVKGVLGT